MVVLTFWSSTWRLWMLATQTRCTWDNSWWSASSQSLLRVWSTFGASPQLTQLTTLPTTSGRRVTRWSELALRQTPSLQIGGRPFCPAAATGIEDYKFDKNKKWGNTLTLISNHSLYLYFVLYLTRSRQKGICSDTFELAKVSLSLSLIFFLCVESPYFCHRFEVRKCHWLRLTSRGEIQTHPVFEGRRNEKRRFSIPLVREREWGMPPPHLLFLIFS